MNLYRHAFDSFAAQVSKWATEHRFGSHAASMELCLHGNLIHRVHLHAFFGPKVDFMGCECRHVPSFVDVASFMWLGSNPQIRGMRSHSRKSVMQDETVGGLYYVLMEKPGTMFRVANLWPFQDCRKRCMSAAGVLRVRVVCATAKSYCNDVEFHGCRGVPGLCKMLFQQWSKWHFFVATTCLCC